MAQGQDCNQDQYLSQGSKCPVIGITMGDPQGIGAEIIVKSLASGRFDGLAKFVIFGLSEQISSAVAQTGMDISFHREHHEDIRRYRQGFVLLDYDEIAISPDLGRVSSEIGGVASMKFCVDAIAAAQAGMIDAIVTAPISKTSWALAGYTQYPGHTELLADKCDSGSVAMMFHSPKLRVVLATIHHSLLGLRDVFTTERVFESIKLADQALREWFGITKPKIAVAGLNPHAGEGGRFGDEEELIITPAIIQGRQMGIDVTGPFPADTIFLKAIDGEYDCVIAMYHDQGLIPVKLLAWREAVNVTLGIGIIRTSPDHGTGFDIAGSNQADAGSFIAAVELAIKLATAKSNAIG